MAWTRAVAQLTQGTLVSLDGKTVKASFDRATAASPLHMLSAWCSDQGGLVIGQTKTDTKSNEITAIPELLAIARHQRLYCDYRCDGMPDGHREPDPGARRRLSAGLEG